METPKQNLKEESQVSHLLSFIENNVSKEDFVAWLNTEQDKAYSEADTWEHIKTEIEGNDHVKVADLKTYAKSLGAEQDTEHLLEKVKESTQHAEKTVERLSYLSTYKKFAVAIGGATVFIGILLVLFAFALFFHFLGASVSKSLLSGVAGVSLFIGLLNILAGLLLSTR